MDDLPPKLYTVPVCNVMMPIVEHHVRTAVFKFYIKHTLLSRAFVSCLIHTLYSTLIKFASLHNTTHYRC